MLVYLGQLAAFRGCVALGLTVKNADVHSAIQLVTVPLPVAQQDVPCDPDDSRARGAYES